MTILAITAACVGLVGVFVLLARNLGPTRSVAHILYDAEQSRDTR